MRRVSTLPGPPFRRYERTQREFFIVAGFPTRAPITATGRVEADTLPGGLAASFLYRGDYAGIAVAHDAAQEWLSDHGYRAAAHPWESYLDGPEVAQPRTILHDEYPSRTPRSWFSPTSRLCATPVQPSPAATLQPHAVTRGR